jgi:hypothetical protein
MMTDLSLDLDTGEGVRIVSVCFDGGQAAISLRNWAFGDLTVRGAFAPLSDLALKDDSLLKDERLATGEEVPSSSEGHPTNSLPDCALGDFPQLLDGTFLNRAVLGTESSPRGDGAPGADMVFGAGGIPSSSSIGDGQSTNLLPVRPVTALGDSIYWLDMACWYRAAIDDCFLARGPDADHAVGVFSVSFGGEIPSSSSLLVEGHPTTSGPARLFTGEVPLLPVDRGTSGVRFWASKAF